MSAVVDLEPGPSRRERLTGLPVRVPLSEAALLRLAEDAGLPLPWPATRSPHPLSERLSGAAPTDDRADPVAELAALGLLGGDGRVRPCVVAALAAFGRAQVHVDVDLARRTPAGGTAQLHAWHRGRGDRVTWLVAAGGRFELGWCEVAWWQDLLASLVPQAGAAPGGAEPGGATPADGLSLPWSMLLASADAVRQGRDDLLSELVRRHPGEVRAPEPLDDLAAGRQLRLLHRNVTGRLRATVAGHGPSGDRRLGVIGWLQWPDGWRALTPDPGRHDPGRPAGVRLDAVAPARLGAEVARLAIGVRGW